MTDPTHDPQAHLDELASAYLDGETSPEEARRVADDPVLLARVAQLRAVREAVRAADHAADPVRREVAIAAAMAVAGHEPAPVAVGDQLAAARARRAGARRWVPLAGVAAAAALAALLLPRISDDGSRDDTVASKVETFEQRVGDPGDGAARDDPASAGAEDDQTLEAAPDDLGAPTTGGAADTGPATAGGDAGVGGDGHPATTTTAPESFTTVATPAGHLVDLGSFEDGEREQLVAAAPAAADEPEGTTAAHAAGQRRADIDACVAPMEAAAEDEGASVLYAAVAEVGDTTVVGIAVELDGGRELRMRYLEGCDRWFEARLDEPDPSS